jgi:HEAT repeat protein
MPPGTPITSSVAAAIERQCDVFLFVLSADSLNSTNCMGELEIALRADRPIIVLRRARCAIPVPLRDQIHLDVPARLVSRALDRLVDGIHKLAREGHVGEILTDPDPDLRVEAARILASLGRPRGVRLIARRMDTEPDHDVLHWFVDCLADLARIGPAQHKEVVTILRRFHAHTAPRVRHAVEDALIRLGAFMPTDGSMKGEGP